MSQDLGEALKALPHGVEFRFVTRLEQLNPGVSARAVYVLAGDEPLLRGHFPGRPMMPGVLLVEAIAQVAGIICQTDPEHEAMGDVRLAAVRGAKILEGVVPPAEIVIDVAIDGRMGNLVQASGITSVDGREVASAKVTMAGRSQR